MKIVIKRTDVAVRSGTGEGGKPWKMTEQQGFAFTVDKNGVPDEYPSKITVRLEDGQAPYAPGEYELEERSYYVGQYGRLTLGNLVLRPIAAKGAMRAA